jgi:hypothetical protein
MKPQFLPLVCLAAVTCALPFARAEGSNSCAKTLGSGQKLGKPFPDSEGWYGNESLAVILPREGLWWGMGPGHKYRDKLFWWSYGFKPGSEADLMVTGRRLDGASPPADISKASNAYAESLGGWAMLVAVEFPSAGCWEITGEYLGQKLSFVVEVPAERPSE